jgi:elongation factor G
MAKLDLTRLRNMGVIAHIDAGKTTTTEHILYYAGAIHRLGEVDKGTTETDYDEEEQERGITIYSACIPFEWRDSLQKQQYTINLIDTPGHVDFTAEVERSLRVLDGAVVVFDAQKGVEAQSETVWRQADKYSVPRLIFINKMDIVGADFEASLRQVQERLQSRPVPVTIPIGSGSPKDSPTPFAGVIDLVTMEACYFGPSALNRPDGKVVKRQPIPEELLLDAERWRENLVNVLTEADPEDRITTAALEGRPLDPAAVHALLRARTLKNEIQPVFCGSGREHIGVQLLLDGICWYLPGPLDRPPVVGRNPKKDKPETRKPDPDEPLAALVFKIQADPHGELYYLRIYSGTLKPQSRPYNPGKDRKDSVAKIYHVHANPKNKDLLEAAYAGDIVAAIGLKESITGDTLCDQHHPILLESIKFAETVVSMSIEPESTADRQVLEQRLTTLTREDPTFHWQIDKETGQTLISGMGVLHLEIKVHRLEDDFNLRVRVGKPRVSYRETLARPVRVEGECVRQAGTAGLFAKVRVEFEPYTPPAVAGGGRRAGQVGGEQSIVVTSRVDPETLPPAFVAAAEQGIRGALHSGELGYPVMNVRATIVGGEMDAEASNDVAFQAAGADAVHKAMRDNIVLLEPVMRLEVTVPTEYLGAVVGDLGARRAEIRQQEPRGKDTVIEALVPLARMFDYAEELRSRSQGRASSTMEPDRYAPAPDEVLHRLLHPDEEY